MTVFEGKGEGKVHPSRHIYYLIILGGGRILWIMTIRGFLIRIDSWCIVGVGGDTESGDS